MDLGILLATKNSSNYRKEKLEIKANINSVMVGRVLAGTIIVLGFIVAVWNGADAQRGGFRIFLQQMINPVFFACLIIILAEVINTLPSRGNDTADENASDE